MRDFLAALGVEVAIGIVILVSLLVGYIWRDLKNKIKEDKEASDETDKENAKNLASLATKVQGLEVKVAKLETWKDSHSESDVEIHRELKVTAERHVEEVGSFRVESSEQAAKLLEAIAQSKDVGRIGRDQLRDKVEVVTDRVGVVDSKVERLVGALEEQKRMATLP